MTVNADKSSVESETHERGPWVFVTRVLRRLPDGRHFVATSRRHRKGLQPLFVRDVESAVRPLPASAFRPLWAPQRLAWWIAILFAIGSLLFTVGGVAATWPRALPAVLSDVSVVNRIFVVGAISVFGVPHPDFGEEVKLYKRLLKDRYWGNKNSRIV